jgi:hypothetical protein
MDYIYEQATQEQPSFTRYKSGQQEVKYIIKNILFNTF